MTKGEFAFNMWNLREMWNKVLYAVSTRGFTPKTNPIYQVETEATYTQLKKMSLDGADMEKIWSENPCHNTDPIEAFICHVDYLMDKYEELVPDEIQRYVEAEKEAEESLKADAA